MPGTFSAGALNSWLLHQVAPRMAAPGAGAGSSIVRNDGHLRLRGLAFSSACRLCRGYLQKWGLVWLCFRWSSQKLCQPPLPLLPSTTPAEGQSAAGRLPFGRLQMRALLAHGPKRVTSNRKTPKVSIAASKKGSLAGSCAQVYASRKRENSHVLPHCDLSATQLASDRDGTCPAFPAEERCTSMVQCALQQP